MSSRNSTACGSLFSKIVEDSAADRIRLDTAHFRPLWRQALIGNRGYALERAHSVLSSGDADPLSFGVSLLANPDLPERFRRHAPLNPANRATFCGGGEAGYAAFLDAGVAAAR